MIKTTLIKNTPLRMHHCLHELYRPRMMGHCVEPYAARAAG
jgi:hypothetical protein